MFKWTRGCEEHGAVSKELHSVCGCFEHHVAKPALIEPIVHFQRIELPSELFLSDHGHDDLDVLDEDRIVPRTETNVRDALRGMWIAPTQDFMLAWLTFTDCQAIAFNRDPVLVEISLRYHRLRMARFRDRHLNVALLTDHSLGVQPTADQNLHKGNDNSVRKQEREGGRPAKVRNALRTRVPCPHDLHDQHTASPRYVNT